MKAANIETSVGHWFSALHCQHATIIKAYIHSKRDIFFSLQVHLTAVKIYKQLLKRDQEN